MCAQLDESQPRRQRDSIGPKFGQDRRGRAGSGGSGRSGRSGRQTQHMEIHAPHGSTHSWREIAKQLAIITAGVLIALAFEGVVAWADHRILVREAEANLRREIADNGREIEALFSGLATEEKNLEHADELAQMLLDHKKIEGALLSLNFHGASLSDASRKTAEVTGAFGYMDYADVEKYAAIYGLQERFNRLQDRANENFVNALAGVRLLTDSAQPDLVQVQQWKAQIGSGRATLFIEEQLARELQKRYQAALEAR
jgi:hypothetical protein